MQKQICSGTFCALLRGEVRASLGKRSPPHRGSPRGRPRAPPRSWVLGTGEAVWEGAAALRLFISPSSSSQVYVPTSLPNTLLTLPFSIEKSKPGTFKVSEFTFFNGKRELISGKDVLNPSLISHTIQGQILEDLPRGKS